MEKVNANYDAPASRMMVDLGLFDSEPFSLLDVGCSGGIYPLGRIFGGRLRAHGFDPKVEECLRLQGLETNPEVHYHPRPVGLPDGHEWLRRKAAAENGQCPYAYDQYARSSAREHVALLRERAGEAQSPGIPASDSGNGAGPSAVPPTGQGKIGLAEFAADQKLKNVDFIKIDTDGCDLEVLISVEGRIESLGVIGFLVECQYQGSDDETCNSFHNIDRFMKLRGFHVFSMTVSAFSRAALPAPYLGPIPSQTTFGQPAFGDVAFLRDPIWGVNGAPRDLPLEKLLKLICLYGFFRFRTAPRN